MKPIVRLAVVVLGLAFCVWVYFAPHLTVHSMRLAAERGDAKALAAHIDFPALRESVKSQLADAVNERIGTGDGGGVFGALGARLATAIADPMAGMMVDAMISPQALSLIFTGRGLARDGLAAATPGASDRDRRRPGGGIELPHWDAQMTYRDGSTFTVILSPDDDTAMPATLVFKRYRLLWWKLSGIEFQPRP